MSTVAVWYGKDPGKEWGRLAQDAYHSLEFLVTMHFLNKHLAPESLIFDAGGGSGRYAIELCRLGHQVVLLDVTPESLDLARERLSEEPRDVRDRLIEFVAADIRDLAGLNGGRFDAVLSLGGPISHIPSLDDRLRAVGEMARVARPGALMVISGIGYLAVLRTIMRESSYELLDGTLELLMDRGNAWVGPMEWHFFRADELRSLAESCGLRTLEMAGCQGLSSACNEETNLLAQDEERWRRWLNVLISTASEPAVVDMSEHMLYIGRKEEHR